MKKLFIFALFMFLLFMFIIPLRAEANKIRVIQEGAVLRLHPDANSFIIKQLQMGSTLEYEILIKGWFRVKLPANEDGIPITGYVHSSFVELEESSLKETVAQKTKPGLSNDDNYFLWKRELTSAHSKSSSGVPLLVVGTVIFSPSVYFMVRGPGEGGYYYTWAKILMISGVCIGATCMIFGISNILRGASLVRELEDEGIKRGYMRAGIIPEFQAIGIQLDIGF